MANTEYDALVELLVPRILERLVAGSTAAGEIERVHNLDNIKALAAYRRIGGTEKTVEVPLDILKGQDGKTPVFDESTATSLDPSASPTIMLTQTGTDTSGNPIYALSLGVPKGEKGDSGTILNLKSGTYREPESSKDLPDLPAFADTAEGDAYIVDDDAIDGQYDLYYHTEGGSDWSVVDNWGGVPGPKGDAGTPGTNGLTPYIKNGNWWMGTTDTGVKAKGQDGIQLSDIQVGGRNLVLKSDVPSSGINVRSVYEVSEDFFTAGQNIVIQIKGQLAEDQTLWSIRCGQTSLTSNEYGFTDILKSKLNDKGIYVLVFTTYNTNIPSGYKYLSVAGYPSSTEVSSIEWVKVERGNIPTGWSPAPEDKHDVLTAAQQAVVDSGITGFGDVAPSDSAAIPTPGTSTAVSRANHVHRSGLALAKTSTNLDNEVFGASIITGSASAPTTGYYYVLTYAVRDTVMRGQIAISTDDISFWVRRRNSTSTWSAWKKLAASADVVLRSALTGVLYGTDATGAQTTYDKSLFALAADLESKQDVLTVDNAGYGINIEQDPTSGKPVISSAGGGLDLGMQTLFFSASSDLLDFNYYDTFLAAAEKATGLTGRDAIMDGATMKIVAIMAEPGSYSNYYLAFVDGINPSVFASFFLSGDINLLTPLVNPPEWAFSDNGDPFVFVFTMTASMATDGTADPTGQNPRLLIEYKMHNINIL